MKALVLGAGTPPPCDLIQKHMLDAELIVCADGALNWAAEYGIRPHAVVGDMDSAKIQKLLELEENGVKVMRLSRRKDETDAQEAVDYALSAGASEVVLLGMSGSRLDHTLANIHLLVRIEKNGAKGRLCDAHNEIHVACAPIELCARKGTLLSILPLSGAAAIQSLEGLEYPLDNAVLHLEFPRAISNVFEKDRVKVNVANGWVAIFLSRD